MSKVRFSAVLSICLLIMSCNQKRVAQRISLDSGSVGLDGREVVIGHGNVGKAAFALPSDTLDALEKEIIEDEVEKLIDLESSELAFTDLKDFLESLATEESQLSECLKRYQRVLFKETVEKLSQNAFMTKEQLQSLSGHGDKQEILSRVLNKCRLEIKDIRSNLSKNKEEVHELLLKEIEETLKEKLGESNLDFRRLLKEILNKESFVSVKFFLEKIKSLESQDELEKLFEEILKRLEDLEELSEAVESDQDLEEVKIDILEHKRVLNDIHQDRELKCSLEKLEKLRELRKIRKSLLVSAKEESDKSEVLKELLEKIKEAKLERISKEEDRACLQESEELKEFLEELKEKLKAESLIEEKDDDQEGERECKRPEELPQCVGSEVLVESVDENNCFKYICRPQICPVPRRVDCESFGMKTTFVKGMNGCEKIQCQK